MVAAGQDPETTAQVEKTQHHLMHVDRIIEANAFVKLIVMLCEPQHFVLSYKYIGDENPTPIQKRSHCLYRPMTAAVDYRGYVKTAHSAV